MEHPLSNPECHLDAKAFKNPQHFISVYTNLGV